MANIHMMKSTNISTEQESVQLENFGWSKMIAHLFVRAEREWHFLLQQNGNDARCILNYNVLPSVKANSDFLNGCLVCRNKDRAPAVSGD